MPRLLDHKITPGIQTTKHQIPNTKHRPYFFLFAITFASGVCFSPKASATPA
jgi:hypothetical protein